jgi:LysR family hydrogen peroxide-inducible transcriptional activator
MDLRQLNALLAVADHGGFSAAARALHTVQSNVSTHVARLERELGATLIDRSTGTLTEQGEVVANRARRIQAELDSLVSDVTSLNAEVSGTVRIGMIGTTARWLVPRLLDAMRQRHPHVRVVVVDATTSSLLPQLESGRLELAVVNLPVDDPELEIEHLFDEDRVLVAPSGHHLLERERLTLADLDGEPLLLEPQGTTFRDQLDRLAAAAGIQLVPQAEVDGMRLLASLAFQGFGAALLPASAAPGWIGGDWSLVPVDGLDGRSVGLAARKRGMLSAAARASRDVLRAVIASEGPHQQGVYPDPRLLTADETDATAM